MEQIFVRFENKFVITKKQKEIFLKAFLEHGFYYDSYSPNNNPYMVYSIYYETLDYRIARENLHNYNYREKFRIRFYNQPIKDDTIVFLELKKKLKSMGNKRRMPLTYKEAIDFLHNNQKPELNTFVDKQILKEIKYHFNKHPLKPFTYIFYHRVAILDDVYNMRVTFDDNVSFSTDATFKDKTNLNLLPQAEELIVMEVKVLNNYPLWLSELMSKEKVFPLSFSKYTNTYKTLFEGGNIDVFN
ncbi:MAG: polyphosphate polymerase domain-containing protein [Acholeplasmataceae bacterium]